MTTTTNKAPTKSRLDLARDEVERIESDARYLEGTLALWARKATVEAIRKAIEGLSADVELQAQMREIRANVGRLLTEKLGPLKPKRSRRKAA